MTFPGIRELLPQEGRAVLLDRITASDEGGVRCLTHIRDDFPYMVEGKVPALVGIELMAQAAAAFAALVHLAGGSPPRRGYLVSVRGLSASAEAFRAGMDLEVSAKLAFREGRIASFACAVHHGACSLLEATLTVYEVASEEKP